MTVYHVFGIALHGNGSRELIVSFLQRGAAERYIEQRFHWEDDDGVTIDYEHNWVHNESGAGYSEVFLEEGTAE